MTRPPGDHAALLTCRDLADFLMEFQDGTLPLRQRLVFRMHLLLCPPCRRYVKQYRRAIDLGRDALCGDDEALPDDVPEELVRAILSARRSGD